VLRRRPHVGRKPRVPDDPVERLVLFDALAEKWLRLSTDARLDGTGELWRLVDKASKAVKRVREAIAVELLRRDAVKK
jgi:hypothetical protein